MDSYYCDYVFQNKKRRNSENSCHGLNIDMIEDKSSCCTECFSDTNKSINMSEVDPNDIDEFWDISSISTAHKVIKILTIKPLFEHQDLEINELVAFFEDIVEHKNTTQKKNCIRCTTAISKKTQKFNQKFEAVIGAQIEPTYDCPGQFSFESLERDRGGTSSIYNHQLLIMQFQMLERKIRQLALKKAEDYLISHLEHKAYQRMVKMVQQTYQIMLTPDNAYVTFRDSLSIEQRRTYLCDNLRLLNIQENKHPMASRAQARLNQYFSQ